MSRLAAAWLTRILRGCVGDARSVRYAEQAQILLAKPCFEFARFIGIDGRDHLLDAAHGNTRAEFAGLVRFKHSNQKRGEPLVLRIGDDGFSHDGLVCRFVLGRTWIRGSPTAQRDARFIDSMGSRSIPACAGIRHLRAFAAMTQHLSSMASVITHSLLSSKSAPATSHSVPSCVTIFTS